MSDKVFLMGAQSDVINKIYGARLFILSSVYEGMPNALMEAMCLGIPVISSDCPCGGPRELITDGQNGFLFKNDNEQNLLETMERALTYSEIEIICLNEKDLCVTHSSTKIFNQWKDYIDRVIKL